ncbi:2,3-diphosphoglycerate-dependent phosphoglycerate mutase [Palleronia sp.]|uniref:2,3-diphosphoglycerate-dependent phosphoglycerate mutase n=1 Tax=Palleronia sp. TaxID=1940284 RepID=UPI0035C878E2
MPRLILLRHGESVWNRDNLFTGWTDVDLSEGGVAEAHKAAELLKRHDITFDHCFTSVQRRAIKTLWIVLDELDLMWLPVDRHWRLNERHYGALQGQNKDEKRCEVGEEQVHAWRRSFATRPPALTEDDERFPGHDRRYSTIPDADIPRTESLQDCIARTLPYWQICVEAALMDGRTPLVVAHGNSLRGIVKHLDGISDDDISGIEIPTGIPLVYDLDEALRPTGSRYLEDTG